jgi:hypothetical protein
VLELLKNVFRDGCAVEIQDAAQIASRHEDAPFFR